MTFAGYFQDDVKKGDALAQTFTQPVQTTAVNRPGGEAPQPAPEPQAPATTEAPAPAPAPKPEAKPAPAPAPATKPAPKPAPAPVAASGDDKFRVQIASLRSRAEAEDYWQRASGNRPELLGGAAHYIHQVELEGKGTYYRLQVGNFGDRASANSLCDKLKATELSCYAVPTP